MPAPPLLAPFLNAGVRREAKAAGAPTKRLLLFCTMGTYPPAWKPTVSGETITAWSDMTAPLDAIKDSVVLVEGMPSGNISDGHGAPDGITGMGYGYYNGQLKTSVDQFVANQLIAAGVNRPIASLLLGGATNGGGGMTFFLRRLGRHQPADHRLSALGLHDGVRRGATDGHVRGRPARAQKEHPRLVTAEATSLKGTLGSAEGAKLDAHLDSIRQLENKLTQTMASGASCMKPTAPGADSTYTHQGDADALAMNVIHQNIIASAFACDITRVAAIEYGNDQSLKVNAPGLPYDDQHGGFIHSGASTNFANLIQVRGVPRRAIRFDRQSAQVLPRPGRLFEDALRHDARRVVSRHGRRRQSRSEVDALRARERQRRLPEDRCRRPLHQLHGAHERILLNLCEAMGVTSYKGFGDPDLSPKSPLPNIAA